MRRGLASLIIGLSLILATFSWAGFTLSRTVLDPGRSERLADQLLDNPEVRSALVSRLADTLESQLPQEIPVPRQAIELGAETALEDPRVEALIRDGLVEVHQNALAGNPEPVIIDANALGAAGRDALVGTRPELDLVLPETPPLQVELPTAGLAWLGSVKNFVDRFTLLSAIVAVLGATVAFIVARDRAPVLRRVAYWGYGTAAFWLAVGYLVPWVAGMLSPTSAAITTAVVDVFFGAMIGPATFLVGFATVMLVISFLWPSLSSRRGAAKLQPKRAKVAAAGGPGLRPRGDNVVADLRTSNPATVPMADSPIRRSSGADSTQVMPIGGTGAETTRRSIGQPQTQSQAQPQTQAQPQPQTQAQPQPHQSGASPSGPAAGNSMPADNQGAGAQTERQTEWREGFGYLDDNRVAPFLETGDADIDLNKTLE